MKTRPILFSAPLWRACLREVFKANVDQVSAKAA